MVDQDWQDVWALDAYELEYLAKLKERLHDEVEACRFTRSELERLRRRAGTRARRERMRLDRVRQVSLPGTQLTLSPNDAQLNTQ